MKAIGGQKKPTIKEDNTPPPQSQKGKGKKNSFDNSAELQ